MIGTRQSAAAGLLALTICFSACRPSAPPTETPSAGDSRPSQPGRVLVIAGSSEPGSVALRAPVQSGSGRQLPIKLFNAQLAQLDARGQPVPQLAESLPRLGSDSWQLFPDGRMQTTFKMRDGLSWHDGAPLTADDFVFSWQVYSTPELGGTGTPPLHAIEEVRATDARTLLITWKIPYPDAGSLAARDRDFPPLPRHLLEGSFQAAQGAISSFANHPYWSREFVGAGPYRVDQWEPGAFIDARAFDAYAIGRPKVERIRLRFIADVNTLVANVLTGEIHLAEGLGDVGRDQVQTLRRAWVAEGAGQVLREPGQWGATHFQLRPEYASPAAILDPRVRRALAYAVDKAAINGALYDGEGTSAASMFPPSSAFGAASESAAVAYPYDLRRSEMLMTEAGFRRGGEGTYLGPTNERFSAELRTNAGPDAEAELLIMANGWRQSGFDIQEAVHPSALVRNAESRATFSSMFTYTTTAGEPALIELVRSRVPTPENRWLGGNRSSWTDPEYERLVESFNSTLDAMERGRKVAQLVRIFTEALPVNSLFFRPSTALISTQVRGPAPVAPETNMGWNAETWEFR
ncbi:MAG: hypothetical protein HW416_2329 [Chloroflexi bacterium]|nr:hypothetical protein [Chloroflexota bacterium]